MRKFREESSPSNVLAADSRPELLVLQENDVWMHKTGWKGAGRFWFYGYMDKHGYVAPHVLDYALAIGCKSSWFLKGFLML